MSVYNVMLVCHAMLCLCHARLSHLLRGQPHLLECYCLIGTRVYIQYQNDQVFLPYSVNCSQVAMFQIMPALCPHGQAEGWWLTKCWQAWTRWGAKIPEFVRTSFMIDPTMKVLNQNRNKRNFHLTLQRSESHFS